MATRSPTVNDLIKAFKDGIEKPDDAQLLYAAPKAYATREGWHFDDDEDVRIGKFRAVTPAAYEVARKLYEASTSVAAKKDLLEDLSTMLCAATRTVNWSGLTEEEKDQTAQKC